MSPQQNRLFSIAVSILLFCFFMQVGNVYAQNQWISLPDGQKIDLPNSGSYSYSLETEDSQVKSLVIEDPSELIKVIVEFKDPPLARLMNPKILAKSVSMTTTLSSLQSAHSQFKTDLANMAQRQSSQNFQFTVKHDYYRALNGVALECNRGMLGFVNNLPDVKKVFYDRQVKVNLTESVAHIRADVVQDSLGYKGDGILVGVVDTGIDYEHEALGGGLGESCRIIGGYDFFYKDNDPMDRHGHGTHIAGIIGANSSDLIGVATNVKFLAVKVLSDNGVGDFSDVVAGIEYCLDPDNNPATDDAVDIINMSLGGSPEQDSPLDLAVNNASDAGILSVVAAGNGGIDTPFLSPYQTIGTPGTAETALTVGACDKSDVIADFSSRGPDPIHYAIKPEVIAPGVDIVSAKAGGGTIRFSGTSMSAPHVSGVAALLKQQHPDWKPEQLKATIVNSATSINDSVSPYTQGNGRVDALQAATIGLTVRPSTLSFGFVDLQTDVWIDTVSLKIRNLRHSPQQITLNPQHNLPSGAELSLDQNNFTLAPLQEKIVTAIISVSKFVPVVEEEPFAYSGNIMCQSDSDRVRIPFGFIKSNVLVIESDLELTTLFFWEPGTGKTNYLPFVDGKKKIVNMETGNYNLLAQLGNVWDGAAYYIERKEIDTGGLNYIVLNHKEAIYRTFNNHNQVYDNNNRLITALDTCEAFFNLKTSKVDPVTGRDIGLSLGTSMTLPLTHIFTSLLDSSWQVTQQIFKAQGGDGYGIYSMTDGVQSQNDLFLPSGSDQLAEFYANFTYKNPGSTDYVPYLFLSNYSGGLFQVRGIDLAKIPTVHFTLAKDQRFDAKDFCSTSLGIMEMYGGPHPFVMSPEIRASEQGEIFLFDKKRLYRPDDTEIVPILSIRSSDTLQVDEYYDRAVNFPIFQLEQDENAQLLLSPGGKDINFDGGGIIQPEGMRLNNGWFPTPFRALFTPQLFSNNKLFKGSRGSAARFDDFYYKYDVNESEEFRLVADGASYELFGQKGQSTLYYDITSIESEAFRPDLPIYFFTPSLDVMQILGDGTVTSWLRPEQTGQVRLVVFDPKTNVITVGFSLVADDGTETKLQTESTSNKEYLASIPNLTPGFWDVIARVKTQDGNSFELMCCPAFYYGSSLDSIQFDARLRLSTFELNNLDLLNFHAGDTLKYTVTYKNFGNIAAENVTINVPETDCLELCGSLPVAIAEIKVNRTAQISLNLMIKEKTVSSDTLIFYPLTVNWTSNGKTFKRIFSIPVELRATTTTLVKNEIDIPESFTLFPNYPNPFNMETVIQYALPKSSHVVLKVYDMLGREVDVIVNEKKSAGYHRVYLSAINLASGVYFYRISAEEFTAIKKMLLLK